MLNFILLIYSDASDVISLQIKSFSWNLFCPFHDLSFCSHVHIIHTLTLSYFFCRLNLHTCSYSLMKKQNKQKNKKNTTEKIVGFFFFWGRLKAPTTPHISAKSERVEENSGNVLTIIGFDWNFLGNFLFERLDCQKQTKNFC